MGSISDSATSRTLVAADAILAALGAAGLRNTVPRRIIAQHLAEYSVHGAAL